MSWFWSTHLVQLYITDVRRAALEAIDEGGRTLPEVYAVVCNRLDRSISRASLKGSIESMALFRLVDIEDRDIFWITPKGRDVLTSNTAKIGKPVKTNAWPPAVD